MKPPFVVSENGALDFYPSLESMLRSLEPIDVENGEYQVYDGAGRRIFIEARAKKAMWGLTVGGGEVVVAGEEEAASHVADLRRLLLAFLRYQGLDFDENSSLEELLNHATTPTRK